MNHLNTPLLIKYKYCVYEMEYITLYKKVYIQYNTINNLYCAEYLTKLSLSGALQV